ncbi:MAG TPA: G/U mismatch-specific DNA glycosylase [Polyangiaceae bacterium]|nr:G/U mismatch-specific DNA glycosylase [Polyangiaceae bacterium]
MPDLAGSGMRVLFCGINPSLYSAVVGHHFARPGNRFWKTLHAAGFTARVLAPHEELELVEQGMGITNLASRATATADEVAPEEVREGMRKLRRKVARWRPSWVAFLGLGAYRCAIGDARAELGRQSQTLAGASVWALPNPSGLNAHYQLDDLARVYAELARAAGFHPR